MNITRSAAASEEIGELHGLARHDVGEGEVRSLGTKGQHLRLGRHDPSLTRGEGDTMDDVAGIFGEPVGATISPERMSGSRSTSGHGNSPARALHPK